MTRHARGPRAHRPAGAGDVALTAANTSVQLGVDPWLRGRVMALYIMVLMGGTPIGSPILGWLGETLGPRWTLLGGGAATVLGVVASVVILRIHLQRQGKQLL